MKQAVLFLFLIFAVVQQVSAQQTVQAKPFVLGEIRELNSKVLAEKRTLNIYLPEGYNPTDTTRYPVIYLLDGSADEDFIHIVGLVQFCNFEWVNILPKSIVVGIANVDRRRDFSFPTTITQDKADFPTTGGSAKFIGFLEQELQPFITRQYKTNVSRMLIGQSFGALLATEVLYTKPALFNTYILISPSLWWDNQSMFNRKAAFAAPGFTQKTRVFVGVGKEGDVMEADAKRFAQTLEKAGKHLQVQYRYFPDENHATIFHDAVFSAFKTLGKPH